MDKSNVRKVFIIGNGFDLSLGYPTRFKDFIDFCKNWKAFYDRPDDSKYTINANESNINSMKLTNDDNGAQINHWNNEEMSHLKIYCDKDDEHDFDTLNSLINNNGLIKYLINKSSTIEYDKWSDFENRLLEICEMIEEYEQQLIVYSNDKNAKFQYNLELTGFVKYIFVENNFFSQSRHNNHVVPSSVRNDKLKLIQKMSSQLIGFCKAFNIYLKRFLFKMEPPQWSYEDSQEDIFVLDFNYTDSCKQIFKNAKIDYIHGYQHDDNIVIGINSDTLGQEYDLLRKNFLRMNLKVKTRQTNQLNLMGKYDDINDSLLKCYNNGVRIDTQVIVIGQSLSKVDWDVLVNYFNNDSLFSCVAICYHRSYTNQLLHLYQMISTNDVDVRAIDQRVDKGYYGFIQFSNLQSLLHDISNNFSDLIQHRHADLSSDEDRVLKEIVDNQDELIGGAKYITTINGFNEAEFSELLEGLGEKGYIDFELAPARIGGRKAYSIKRVLKN